jgi:hypothetical protein
LLARNIDEVITLLDRIIAAARERRSRAAFFPALYRAVTMRVRAGIHSGEFADGPRMDRFDTAFANRYFTALDASRVGVRTSRAWQVAFNADARSGTLILQHLLLGMNAHINFDLPIAVLEVAPPGELSRLQGDFLAINAILASLLDTIQETIEPFSPLLDVLDRVGGRTDESLLTFSIVHARDEAWHEATRLSAEMGAHRERSILSLDRRVALLAERIIVPGGPCGLAIELISRTEEDNVAAITDALLAVA